MLERYLLNKAHSTTQKRPSVGDRTHASSQYRQKVVHRHSLHLLAPVMLVAGVNPSTRRWAGRLRQGAGSTSGTSSYFLFGCIMLININQNKKNSGKRISCNKGNKMITKHAGSIKSIKLSPNITNTRKTRRTWVSFFRT